MTSEAVRGEHEIPLTDEAYNGPIVPATRALSTVSGRIPGATLALWLALTALGVVGFVLAVLSEPQRAWMSVWSNFLFWTALAEAGIVFGAVLHAAGGHWGKPFRRLAQGAGAFLPASFVVLILLSFGAEYIFPWTGEVEGHINRTWLSSPGAVFLRNFILMAALYVLSCVYLRIALRPDAPHIAEKLSGWRRGIVTRMTRGWRGDAEELARSRRIMGWLSPVLILAWVVVFSVLSFDLAMSLMPGFYSIVWGPVYFVGGFLSLLALIGLLVWRYRSDYGLEDVWGKWELHDLGKLTFAFVIFWTYLWWSQFLVIWFGNIGRETIFFEQRTVNGFGGWFTAEILLTFALPFLLLLGRRVKMYPPYLAGVALLILLGFWIERYLLVAPSVWAGDTAPFGLAEITISLGFVGLFGLCYSLFASTFPKVPIHEVLVGRATQGP